MPRELAIANRPLVNPAVPVGVDRRHEARLRFEKADLVSQQRLIRWIGHLALRTWRRA